MKKLYYILPTIVYKHGNIYYSIRRPFIFEELTKHFSLKIYAQIQTVDDDKISNLLPYSDKIEFFDFFEESGFFHFFKNYTHYKKKLLNISQNELCFVQYPYKITSMGVAWILRRRKLTIWVRSDTAEILLSPYVMYADGILKGLQRSLVNPLQTIFYKFFSKIIFRSNLIFYTANVTIDKKNHQNQHEIISCPVFNDDPDLIKTNFTNSICFVGDENPRKGLTTILQALQAIPKDSRPTLSIIGVTEFKKYKNIKIAQNLNIIFHGPIYKRKEFFETLSRCDMVIMPSFGEKQGKVQLEGMSCGVVPICSDSGGTYYTIHNYYNGLLFKQGDYRGLAMMIQLLYSNQALYYSLQENGLQYTKTISLEKQIELMSTVIQNHYC